MPSPILHQLQLRGLARLQITQYTSLISRSKSAMSPVRMAAPESMNRAANDPIFGDTTITSLSRERPTTMFKATK